MRPALTNSVGSRSCRSSAITSLLVVGAIGAIWLPQLAARLRGDLVASLGYVTNWWLVAENSAALYFSAVLPQILQPSLALPGYG